ncbi:hypothetical protein ACSFBX_35020 [Variovorax sp. RB2P76]
MIDNSSRKAFVARCGTLFQHERLVRVARTEELNRRQEGQNLNFTEPERWSTIC